MWSVVRSAAATTVRVSRAPAINKQLVGLGARVRVSAAILGRLTGRRTFILSAPLSAAKASTTKKTTATRSRARKTTGTKGKPAVRSRKTKAKSAASKKKATARARPKKKLTEEEKTKAEIRELKKVALLKEPARLPDRSWTVYASQHLKGIKGKEDLPTVMKSLSSAYKTLRDSEIESLKSAADQNRLANEASYKSWVEAHTPAEIDEANRARRRLKRTLKASSRRSIHDDRQPKRGVSAFVLFTKSRWQSGEFAGRPLSEAASSISSEWKGLTAAESRPFYDSAKADRDRYEHEVKSVLGRDVRRRPAAAA